MNDQIKLNNKSQLAKLLATENISIQSDPNAKIAAFDLKNRVLHLPVWKQLDNYLYDMLVVHEVGHALETPADGWINAIDSITDKVYHKNDSIKKGRIKSIIKHILNVVEDARIDKLQRRRYPGSKLDYVNGSLNLLDMDFFEIRNRNINTLGFVDRINMQFKVGIHNHVKINFSVKERGILTEIATTETWDEVVNLTEKVYRFARSELIEKERKEKEEAKKRAQEFKDAQESSEKSNDQESFENEDDQESSENDNDQESFENEDDFQENEDDSGEKKDSNSKNIDDSENASEETETNDNKETDAIDDSEEEVVPENVETVDALERNQENLLDNSSVNYVSVKMPVHNFDNIIDDWSKVYSEYEAKSSNLEIHEDTKQNYYNSLNTFIKEENKTISYMVKEFEIRKRADEYARTAVSKTGVIDTNKLHNYKYSDDIFRRLTVVNSGKNHGFVMLLDWSGSMHYNLDKTIKQLYSLMMFCKRVQIPFDVYLFKDSGGNPDQFQLYEKDQLVGSWVCLRNIFSSRMSKIQFNNMMYWFFMHDYFRLDSMGSTPLNSAISCLYKIVCDFQKRNNVQIVSTIILTDGDPTDSFSVVNPSSTGYTAKKYYLNDPITNRSYAINSFNRIGETFLRVLKDRIGANIVGIYLHSKNVWGQRAFKNLLNNNDKKFYRQNGYIAITKNGYEEYYIINVDSMNTEKTEYEINDKMSIKKMVKEFSNANVKKLVNRAMLKQFVEKISKKS